MKKRILILSALMLILSCFVFADTFNNRTVIYSENEALFDSEFYLSWTAINFEYKTNVTHFSKNVNGCLDIFFSTNVNVSQKEGDVCNRNYVLLPNGPVVFSYSFGWIYLILIGYVLYFIVNYLKKHRLFLLKKYKITSTNLGANKFRIEIIVENNGFFNYKNSQVIDYAPKLFDIKPGEMGTLQPDIHIEGKHKILKFNLKDVAPGDKFLIYYDLVSKIDLAKDYIPEDSDFNCKGLFRMKQKKIHSSKF